MLYLKTLAQTIAMCRNQPHVVTFSAQDQSGAPVDLSSVTSAYLIIGQTTMNDQPWPYPGTLPSVRARYDTGFVLGGTDITLEFTEAMIGLLPLGQLVYEFGVSEDDTQFIVCQQGTVVISPSLWSPV